MYICHIELLHFILFLNSHLLIFAGTLTKKKISGQLRIYSYDQRLFHPGVSCPTCQLVKPARSKHCSESSATDAC